MPRAKYVGTSAHRSMKIGLRHLIFFPGISMRITDEEAAVIEKRIKDGAQFIVEYDTQPPSIQTADDNPPKKPTKGKKKGKKTQPDEGKVVDPFDFAAVDECDFDDDSDELL